MRTQPDNLLDRLIAEAQADDYVLAGERSPVDRRRIPLTAVLLFAVIGVTLGVAAVQTEAVAPQAQQRRAELVERVRAQSQAVAEAGKEAEQLRTSVSQLQQLASGGLSEEFAGQLRQLEIVSGFVPLTGPGARLTLRDATPPFPRGVSREESRVLDVDMQLAVNGLWQAGAQAIAINDIRLTTVTAIRTAGEAILVDYRPLEPPYRIVALGPADLASRFESSETAKELNRLRRQYGIQSEVTAVDEARVPASTANLPIRAEVLRGES